MSFFDLIETDLADQGPDPGEGAADPGPPRHDQQTRPPKQKPERLKFLKPCPICEGRQFTHATTGGFFCNTCQPGIVGRPIFAAGNSRQQPEKVTGLPCGGCGSTIYTRIENGFVFDDGTICDGWHCGGTSCHIKLLTGNKTTDQATRKTLLSAGTQAVKPSRGSEGKKNQPQG